SVKKCSDTNSLSCSLGLILLVKESFFRLVVGKFEGAVEQMAKVDFFFDNLIGRGGHAGLEKVALANFDGRNADDLSDSVHVAFHGEECLGSAESAKGAVRRRVRGDGLAANGDIGPVVRATRVDRAARENDRRQRGVRSAVHDDVNFAAKNFSVGIYCCLVV